MHIDPELTDAFNALISGEKWWVSLPKDLYEFRDELTCDPQCSEPFDNFHRQTGVWFIHIMPQIRYVCICVTLSHSNSISKDKCYICQNFIFLASKNSQ